MFMSPLISKTFALSSYNIAASQVTLDEIIHQRDKENNPMHKPLKSSIEKRLQDSKENMSLPPPLPRGLVNNNAKLLLVKYLSHLTALLCDIPCICKTSLASYFCKHDLFKVSPYLP